MRNIILIAITLMGLSLFSEGSAPSNILSKIDRHLTFETDLSCTFTMVVYRNGEKPEMNKMRLYHRGERGGKEEKFLALVIKPDVDKGTGYLGIGDNYWIYDPESRKFSHSSARENVQDSDTNNDDLGVSSYEDDYDVVSSSEGKLGELEVYILILKAKNNSVAYENLKLWVGRNIALTYKAEGYSLSGKLMRTVLAPKWTKIEGHYIYKKVYFIDELKKGNKTILTFEHISLKKLDDMVFTKAYLERVSR